jgi:hypothetical protein
MVTEKKKAKSKSSPRLLLLINCDASPVAYMSVYYNNFNKRWIHCWVCFLAGRCIHGTTIQR